ncbi:MAG TPA: nucleotidyltransferase family protein [Spirochaetota bacterium]|nr:nucleotidyltransferase family protein [Spirochaetota bacterium]HOS32278.1 nucleotidyltransferase family protein [Spirochaetota bacterium]HOS55689.1 nucleotidyltransferase family protein [Spirochaetota bacterium]HPK61727.1 nucleotidyltransferase family protein [Spirochaetota bacterium]HQF78062.1 nucleotidyltransferase family protein [Spirochaetota bacterium]
MLDKSKIINIIKEILYKNEVKKAALFGSYARSDYDENSDIDIIIEFNNDNKSLLDIIGIKQDIEDKINIKVDLLTYNSINPKIRKNILNNQEIIYG